MIKTLIFDFGDIFINLDKDGTPNALKKLGLTQWNQELDNANLLFETGAISPENFIKLFEKYLPNASKAEILHAWNAVLLNFPKYRLDFLVELSKKYELYLLSNTDSIHIKKFEETVGEDFTNTFYNCFKKVYYSFELGMRKPNRDIFEYVINTHQLEVSKTLFVDDKKANTNTASELGLQIWNLQVGQEDVIDLFKKGFPLR
jgi:HAD superfamily hydrolase (TIGR01509 family)